MINRIIIKSGIDINSVEFKKYYMELKERKVWCYYLDLAVSNNSPLLINPIAFEEKEYGDYKIDDISFVISGDEIIGHQVYLLEKIKPVIPLGIETGNHLDMDRVKNLPARLVFGQKESFCKYNIDINNQLIEYLSNRVHGKLEYKGIVNIENKVNIKK